MNQTFQWLGKLAILLVAGYFTGQYLKSLGEDDPLRGVSWWALLAVWPVGWLMVMWHELGHAVGGWWNGWRLYLLAAGPLRWMRSGTELQVRWNDRMALWGGLTVMAPVSAGSADAVRAGLVRMVLGGPLFSLIGAVVLLVPAYLWEDGDPSWRLLLWWAGGLSFLIFVVTLIPMTTGGFRNDGKWLVDLLGNDRAGIERICSLAMLAGLSQSSRPRDWPRDLVLACAPELGDHTADGVSAALLRCCYHEDKQELGEAREWIADALAGRRAWPEIKRPILYATAALVHAKLGDAGRAREYFDEAGDGGGGLLDEYTMLHTKAFVLAAEGDRTAAREAALAALERLPKQIKMIQDAARADLEGIAGRSESRQQ